MLKYWPKKVIDLLTDDLFLRTCNDSKSIILFLIMLNLEMVL